MDTFAVGEFATSQTFSGGIRYQCQGLESTRLHFGGPAWVRVLDGGLCLDVFTHFVGKGRPLLVFAQDALVEGRPLPWFYRSKWRAHFPELNMLTFNDPTLYLDRRLRAGYFAAPGSRALLNGFLRHAIRDLGLDEQQTIHYGASAGGYHVLSNSACFPRATHVADIPRVHFSQKHVNQNMEVLLESLGLDRLHSAPEMFRHFFTSPVEKLVYLQHIMDSRFMQGQLPGFLEFVAAAAKKGEPLFNSFQLKFYYNPAAVRGHSPMPDADTIALLKELSAGLSS